MNATLPSSDVIPFPPRQSNGYLRLDHSLLQSSAWQSLPALPTALFSEIAGRHTGFNNGHIGYSVRDGMARFRVGARKVQYAFTALEQAKVAYRTKKGSFDQKTGDRKATEWFVPSLAATPQQPA